MERVAIYYPGSVNVTICEHGKGTVGSFRATSVDDARKVAIREGATKFMGWKPFEEKIDGR